MKTIQRSQLVAEANKAHLDIPVAERHQVTFSGRYKLRLTRDTVYLPKDVFLNLLGSSVFHVLLEEERKQLLIPTELGISLDRLYPANILDITQDGAIEIPGISSFFADAAGGLTVAGCGTFLEVGSSVVMEAEAVAQQELIDDILNNHKGLPTGTAS